MTDEHPSYYANYFLVFLALCVLTTLSVLADVVDIKNKVVLAAIVLAVATAKALFVMMYFMHLKFEGKWKFVLLAPTIILAMGIPMALLPDIGMHYYTVDTPQLEEATHDSSEHQPAGNNH